MSERIRDRLAGGLGRLALDALLATVRFEVRGDEPLLERVRAGRPVIYCLWHGRLLPLTYLHRAQGIAAMISRSRDGEHVARLVEHWGYVTVRGSSTRGGSQALRAAVRHARAGRSLAFTPDGPRGPRERLKPGVLVAARLTGLPIVPLTAGARRAWWLESWDRFLVPKPFARVHVRYAPPIEVPRNAGPAELEALRRRVEAELARITAEADGEGSRG